MPEEWIEVCQQCKRPFSIVEAGNAVGSWPRDSERIECPHCKALWGHEKSAGVFATAPLTPEQEEKRNKGR